MADLDREVSGHCAFGDSHNLAAGTAFRSVPCPISGGATTDTQWSTRATTDAQGVNYGPLVEYTDTDFIADFAQRTLLNLDHVQAQADTGNAAVYEVTQLWNSLLGLIVLPRERDLRRIPEIPMAELWSRGWPRLTETGRAQQSLRDLVSALRRAVAHFNVEFTAGPDREITTVTVWNQASDSRGRPVPGSRGWEGQIAIPQLDRLVRLIADLYVREFASTAA
jgi:HEPN pEK499 p136